MSKVYERWAKKGEKDDITAREYLELLEEHGKGDDALKEMAETLKERTRTEGVGKTSFSHPASFDYVLRKLKDLGKRETGYSNKSLMITIAVIEFLNRHENNPQPTLSSSVRGIELPSSVRNNLTQEFINEIRNLPEEMARRKLRKNGKFLAKAGIGSVGGEGKKEEAEREGEEASKDEWEWKRYKPIMRDLVNAMKQGDVKKMKSTLEELPPAREVPLSFRGHVRSAEKRVERNEKKRQHQKRLEEQRKKQELEEVGEEEQKEEGGGSPWVVSSPEELYSGPLLRYKQAIARAKDLIGGEDTDEEDMNKARALLEDLTLKGAPSPEIERELRHLKETLGIK